MRRLSLGMFLMFGLTLGLAGRTAAFTWSEAGDAGELLGTAQIVSGSGQLEGIQGSFLENDTDLYQIYIADSASFSATTVGGSTVDTQLFLFDSSGVGVSFNDDDPGGNGVLQSTLSAVFVPSAGLYYLAITRFDRDAYSAGGLIWNNSPYEAERIPDGPGAQGALAGWTGPTSADSFYQIFLRGTEGAPAVVPEPSTLLLLGSGLLGLAGYGRKRMKK